MLPVMRGIQELAQWGKPVCLAIGVFDGVHRGHQALVSALRDEATQRASVPVVVTFDPHPLQLLRPESAPHLLTSLSKKLEIFRSLGVEHALVLPFNPELARLPASDFVRQLFDAGRPLRLIAVGFRWEFGYRRTGNVALLEQLGLSLGFDVLELAPVIVDGDLVSSTRIRQAVRDGNMDEAAKLLGRPFSLSGTVIRGDGIGRQLGFPTANLQLDTERFQLPARGVYRGACSWGGKEFLVALNVGYRPSVQGRELRVEAHLLDFEGDLYGEEVEVRLLEHLRGEETFSGRDTLTKAIAADIAKIRASATANCR
jgi:riboflavin kinase/FMN adenylyltransferase